MPTRDVPTAGEAWVEAPLLDALGVQVGDQLLLGNASLRLSRVIVTEPDRGAGFMSFSPRVMIAQVDLAASGLIQPASRVSYRLAVAGADEPVASFVAWAADEISSVASAD